MRRTVVLTAVVFGALGALGIGAQRSTRLNTFTLPVGGGAVTIGDLNSDGKPDIVTIGSDAVAVYFGDGRGRFEQPPGSPFAAGKNAHTHTAWRRETSIGIATSISQWRVGQRTFCLSSTEMARAAFANEARHPRMSLLAMWTETGLTMWPLRTWGATTSRCSLEADREFALLEAAHCLQAQRQRRSPSRI